MMPGCTRKKRARSLRVVAVRCGRLDGYPASIDVSVSARQYEASVVIRFTDPGVKHHLGELSAEEFYRDTRLQKVSDRTSRGCFTTSATRVS